MVFGLVIVLLYCRKEMLLIDKGFYINNNKFLKQKYTRVRKKPKFIYEWWSGGFLFYNEKQMQKITDYDEVP